MNYGLTQMEQGRYESALEYYGRAREFEPDYPTLEINLAIANGALRRDAEAERHFRRAIELAPDEADSYYYLGRWEHETGRLPEAVGTLKEAIARNPAHIDARDLLLECYAAQGDYPDLQALAGDTLRIAPADSTATRFLSVAAQAGAANHVSSTAVQQTPESLLTVSLKDYQTGDYPGCLQAAQQALRLRPQYAEAFNNISAAYAAMGRWDEAMEAAREALRIKPNYELARGNLAWAESRKRSTAK
jgi:tetratricopeptide (TPR) repeat protein